MKYLVNLDIIKKELVIIIKNKLIRKIKDNDYTR